MEILTRIMESPENTGIIMCTICLNINIWMIHIHLTCTVSRISIINSNYFSKQL
jgi:hypothetical protein